MTDAYMEWSLATAERGLAELYTHPEDAVMEELREGLVPVAPFFPSTVITIRALEVFRALSLRCPRLGIQAFVRAMCDLNGAAPHPSLPKQFSVVFDTYLAIRGTVDNRVKFALGRNTPDWRLKNACPACLYKLEGEADIPLPFLATIDGNNSLKRFWRRERDTDLADGTTAPGASKERQDDRWAGGDYYLPREEVDKWSREGLDDLMKEFVPGSELEDEGDGCTERWQNMREDVTARAYGMYDETGFFPSLCRHGFVLIVVDMVKSGELAKYGFAITAHLLCVLHQLGLGYDIGCKYGKMVRMHPALSSLAADNNFKALVGTFHGHAHNRRCQLSNLSTYVKGVGLEDLEGCESFFSKSNALASTTRYASTFHRQQAITAYLKHADVADAYQGLSLLLARKYRRALQIKQTLPLLRETMASMGVATRSVFETWLEKEKGYLAGLSKEPVQETLQMEYYQKLVNLLDHEEQLDIIRNVDVPFRRHVMELCVKGLAVVQDLEVRLGITRRWVAGDEEWVATAMMVSKRRYQRALDALEGLVVARMFELSKVNMSDTGYKLWKHIAKALQARSKGVKSALERYNEAAAAMSPPRNELSWEQIVDYAFLADFDLLREGREDIWSEPWAQPAGRVAMDQHFKLLRADEEIARLNLEIPRFVTFMVDEEAFLIYHERRLTDEGSTALAHQVAVHRMQRGRFNSLHMERLAARSKEAGVTVVNKERRVPTPGAVSSAEDGEVEMRDVPAIGCPLPQSRPAPVSPADEQEDEASADVDVEAVADAFEKIMHVMDDAPHRAPS
ncbi:hypothetical protein K438DRAFT_1901011 [Mycena galopus ATCC 62051]|nr:hypothetical protein K438DRAFT_1901011 [Mycena galopus ATCC 62051]